MILYRDIKLVGRTTIVLGMVTLAAIAFTIVAGFSHFHVENLRMPKDAFASSTSVILGLGVGMRIGIYDFSGYQDVCQMGDEVPPLSPPHPNHRCTCGDSSRCAREQPALDQSSLSSRV